MIIFSCVLDSKPFNTLGQTVNECGSGATVSFFLECVRVELLGLEGCVKQHWGTWWMQRLVKNKQEKMCVYSTLERYIYIYILHIKREKEREREREI